MSTFDFSTFRVSNTENVETLITNGNALACHFETTTGTGVPLTTSTSSTYASTGVTRTVTVAADELVKIEASVIFSISDGSSRGLFAIYINGAKVSLDYLMSSAISDSSGYATSGFFSHSALGNTGAIAIDTRISRYTGSGTICIGQVKLDVSAFKYRPS